MANACLVRQILGFPSTPSGTKRMFSAVAFCLTPSPPRFGVQSVCARKSSIWAAASSNQSTNLSRICVAKYIGKTAARRGISDNLLINTAFGWGVKGEDQATLVAALRRAGLLPGGEGGDGEEGRGGGGGGAAAWALEQVDRAWFAPPPEDLANATEGSEAPPGPYENRPLVWRLRGGGEAALSTPQQHAQALRALAPSVRPGARCLDVGCGSGYLVAALAALAGPGGRAVGVDLWTEVAQDIAPKCLERARQAVDSSGGAGWAPAVVLAGDALAPETLDAALEAAGGRFDAAHFGAAARSRAALRPFLERALAPGGRAVAPVCLPFSAEQELLQFDKLEDGTVKTTVLGTVMCAMMQSTSDMIKAPHQQKKKLSGREKLEAVKRELEEWKAAYRAAHGGRAPGLAALRADPRAEALFAEFSALNRRRWGEIDEVEQQLLQKD